MNFRLAVFDIAGTTVEDPDGVGGSLKAALTADEVPWKAETVNSVMGIPKPLAIRYLLESAGLRATEGRINSIHMDFQARMIHYYANDPSVKEVDGARDVLQQLRGMGIAVALDTGFDRAIVDVLLKRLGWDDAVIDSSVTSDEVAQGRPFPDMIYKLMNEFGVEHASQVIKVGDTPSDMIEGTAAGCGMVVGVTSGTHSEDLLSPHPHTHLIHSIRDLPALLA